jgi:hypothetical protein
MVSSTSVGRQAASEAAVGSWISIRPVMSGSLPSAPIDTDNQRRPLDLDRGRVRQRVDPLDLRLAAAIGFRDAAFEKSFSQPAELARRSEDQVDAKAIGGR